MALEMTIEFTKKIDLATDYDSAFAFFTDVPATAALFPKVDKLVDLGGGRYQWEMDKVGVAKYTLQVIYACSYENDKEKGLISWTPVDGAGNARNQGQARVTKTASGVTVDFSTKLDLSFSFIPSLAKALVKPLVVREFNGVADKFEENVKAKFEC